jgi:hypothetical protein
VNPALGQQSVHTQQERSFFGSACNNLPAFVPKDGTESVSFVAPSDKSFYFFNNKGFPFCILIFMLNKGNSLVLLPGFTMWSLQYAIRLKIS